MQIMGLALGSGEKGIVSACANRSRWRDLVLGVPDDRATRYRLVPPCRCLMIMEPFFIPLLPPPPFPQSAPFSIVLPTVFTVYCKELHFPFFCCKKAANAALSLSPLEGLGQKMSRLQRSTQTYIHKKRY